MNHFAIKYAITALFFFMMIAKYDIHMFQLSSYRNSRYFRWLAPGNIFGIKRVMAIAMLATAFITGYFGLGFAVAVTVAGWIYCFSEKFKTPLVYTKRVKRLFATDIILFIIIEVVAMLFAGEWSASLFCYAFARKWCKFTRNTEYAGARKYYNYRNLRSSRPALLAT